MKKFHLISSDFPTRRFDGVLVRDGTEAKHHTSANFETN